MRIVVERMQDRVSSGSVRLGSLCSEKLIGENQRLDPFNVSFRLIVDAMLMASNK